MSRVERSSSPRNGGLRTDSPRNKRGESPGRTSSPGRTTPRSGSPGRATPRSARSASPGRKSSPGRVTPRAPGYGPTPSARAVLHGSKASKEAARRFQLFTPGPGSYERPGTLDSNRSAESSFMSGTARDAHFSKQITRTGGAVGPSAYAVAKTRDGANWAMADGSGEQAQTVPFRARSISGLQLELHGEGNPGPGSYDTGNRNNGTNNTLADGRGENASWAFNSKVIPPVLYHILTHNTIIQCQTRLDQTRPDQTILCHTVPCHTMPCHIVACHTTPCHTVPCTTPRHAMSSRLVRPIPPYPPPPPIPAQSCPIHPGSALSPLSPSPKGAEGKQAHVDWRNRDSRSWHFPRRNGEASQWRQWYDRLRSGGALELLLPVAHPAAH